LLGKSCAEAKAGNNTGNDSSVSPAISVLGSLMTTPPVPHLLCVFEGIVRDELCDARPRLAAARASKTLQDRQSSSSVRASRTDRGVIRWLQTQLW
jgi:hypothetical protein